MAFGCRHSGRLRSRTCFCPSGVGAQLLAAHVEQRGAVAADHDLLTILRNVREEHTPAQELLEQFGGCARGFTRRRVDMGAHRPSDPLFPFTTGRLGSDVLTDGGGVIYELSALVRHWNPRDYASLKRLMHDYGVRLTAYLTAAALRRPRLR